MDTRTLEDTTEAELYTPEQYDEMETFLEEERLRRYGL